MGLVEDHPLVRRQHRRVAEVVGDDPHGQIGEEEGVVHDDQIRAGPGPARALVVALLEVGALGAQAGVGLAPDLLPHVVAGDEGKVAARAVLGAVDPVEQRLQLRGAVVGKEVRCRIGRQTRAADRDVVPPALHERPPELLADHLARDVQVLPHQLLLQVDGVGGHHRAFAVADRPESRGDQVRERLARPRTRLHQPHPALVEVRRHEAQHVALSRAVLVAGKRRQRPPGREQSGQLIHLERLDTARLGRLDDHVDPVRGVVDDRRSQSPLVDAGGHGQVRVRGVQFAARVVVDHHTALGDVPGHGQDGRAVAAGDGARVRYHSFGGHVGQEGDLAASGPGHFVADGPCGLRSEPEREIHHELANLANSLVKLAGPITSSASSSSPPGRARC